MKMFFVKPADFNDFMKKGANSTAKTSLASTLKAKPSFLATGKENNEERFFPSFRKFYLAMVFKIQMAEKKSTPTDADFRHRIAVEVRFADMDLFNHVNNAAFLTYIEEARIKYFSATTGWQYSFSREGMILASASLDFIRPLGFKEKLSVLTTCTGIGTKSLTLFHKMIAGDSETVATGQSVAVAFDYNVMKSIPIPQQWKDAISTYEGKRF